MDQKTKTPGAAALLFAQQTLNDELLGELQNSNTDESVVYASTLEALRGALAIEFARLLGGYRIHQAAMSNPDAARNEVYRRYAEHVCQSRRQYGQDLNVVPLSGADAAAGTLAEVLGEPVKERELVRHEDPVVRAYLLARLNVSRAKARCVALEYLVEQLPVRLRVHDSELGKAMTSLYQTLSSRVSLRITTQMKFAILLGGKYLEETRQQMVVQSFGPNMEVMGYLAFDERRPGSYYGEEEAAFRASIDKHLRRPVR